MRVSIGIPSFGRPEKLLRCLEGLAAQTMAPAEVLVGLDGGSADEARAVLDASGLGGALGVLTFERSGYIPVRAALLRAAGGEVFLSMNDDVRPASELVERHIEAHERAGGCAVAAGAAPWTAREKPTAMDELVRRGELAFFDVEQRGPLDPARGWRRCYGLNMSMPTEAALRVGGFHDLPFEYGYDDIEMAWRLQRECGAAIVTAPGAAATHDHRYDARSLMRREYRLGRSAVAYARRSLGFVQELLGFSPLDPGRLGHFEGQIESEARDARRSAAAMLELDRAPGDGLSDAAIEAMACGWLPAKRWLWRRGVVDAAGGRPPAEGAALAELGAAGACGAIPADRSAAPIHAL